MVVKFIFGVCALILVAMPGRLAWADAAQDQLVEQGVAFYDDEEYEKAANAGYANAMYNMSNCYYFGKGRNKDLELNKYWILQASDHGVVSAMTIRSSYDKSEGEDYRYWMNKAREHGSVYAKVSLYLQGYAHDVPDLYIQDKVCVYVRI